MKFDGRISNNTEEFAEKLNLFFSTINDKPKAENQSTADPDLTLLNNHVNIKVQANTKFKIPLMNLTDNPYFEGMVNQIYPSELQLNKAYSSDTEAPFLDLHLSISNGFISSKIYDKRDDFDFDIVNFPF